MKPRIRRQSNGWVVEQWPYLIGIESSFRKACAVAARWTSEGLYVR